MVKSKTNPTDKPLSETKETKTSFSKIEKPIRRKKKSIHANTFEERQENRRRKQEIADRKQRNKDRRKAAQVHTSNIINEVNSWVTDNPLHPSVIPKPTQEGIRPVYPTSREQKTYKAFIRNLPQGVTPQDIDEHFYNRKGVKIHTIRLLCHRKTDACLGWGFLEFTNKLEFDKSLAFNFSLFKGKRILVQQSLRSFVPSKRTPQKVVTYRTPQKTEDPKYLDLLMQYEEDSDVDEGDDIQVLEKEDTSMEMDLE